MSDNALQVYIEGLSFAHNVSDKDMETTKLRMAMAFSPAASPELSKCSPESIGRCIALSALSGLMPGGPAPDVWLIPRAGKAVWQMSHRGYIRLARRAGYEIDPAVVYKGEHFAVTKGTTSELLHRPDVSASGKWDDILCAYVIATKPGAEPRFLVLRKEQIEKRRRKAQTDKVWTEWPEEMTLKTVCARGGKAELWPCDPTDSHVIHADEMGSMGPQEVRVIQPPQAVIASDFVAPPEDDSGGDAQEARE